MYICLLSAIALSFEYIFQDKNMLYIFTGDSKNINQVYIVLFFKNKKR